MIVFGKVELDGEGTYRCLDDFTPSSFSCTAVAAATGQDVGVGVWAPNALVAADKVVSLRHAGSSHGVSDSTLHTVKPY